MTKQLDAEGAVVVTQVIPGSVWSQVVEFHHGEIISYGGVSVQSLIMSFSRINLCFHGEIMADIVLQPKESRGS